MISEDGERQVVPFKVRSTGRVFTILINGVYMIYVTPKNCQKTGVKPTLQGPIGFDEHLLLKNKQVKLMNNRRISLESLGNMSSPQKNIVLALWQLLNAQPVVYHIAYGWGNWANRRVSGQKPNCLHSEDISPKKDQHPWTYLFRCARLVLGRVTCHVGLNMHILRTKST